MVSLSKRIKHTFIYIKDIASSSKGSRFRQNFVKVAKANFWAQVLSLIIYPFITRMYSPADYGTLALFSSILSFLLAFANFRFDWSVPNTTSRVQAAAVVSIGFISLCSFSIVIFLVLWLFSSKWMFWHGFEILRSFWLLLPVALIGNGLHQLMQAWFVREANLTVVSRTKLMQSIVGASLNIVGGIFQLGAWGLIVSLVSVAWVGIGTLLSHANEFRSSLARLSKAKIKASWLRFWRESVLSTLVSIVNTASLAIIPLLFAQFYSTTEVGWYALMYRLAITPIGMFTSAIGQSFWAEAASLVKIDRFALRQLFLRTSVRLTILATPIIAACILGPIYTSFIFGEEWKNAGYVLAALTPLLFGQIVVSPLSHLIIHRKQHWQLLWDVCRLLTVVTAINFSALINLPITLTILITSFINLLMYFLLFWLNLSSLRA